MTETSGIADYAKTLDVKAEPDQVYHALTQEMGRWWSFDVDGSTGEIGKTIRVNFPPNKSYWTFEASKLSKGQLVELTCVDAYHIFTGQPEGAEQEWLGTRLSWDLSPLGSGTRIRFEHQGLTPRLHCFDICQAGWDHFFVTSLAAYLNTGAGMPHSADG